MSSEIFDSFIKIAQEKGMISDGSKSSLKKEAQPYRIDSMDIKDIEALYGVRAPSEDDMEYEHNIIEIAHPNSVVVAPSYDKINGLVENENERQAITLHILERMPTGMVTNHKYAKQQLISSLVCVANDLDNNNKEKLRILADACLMQMSKKALPSVTAALPLLPIVGVVAGTLGLLWWQQHSNFKNDGFEKNHEKLIGELDDFLTSNSSWGVGVDYKKTLIDMVTSFKVELMKVYEEYKKLEPLMDDLQKPKSPQELMQIAQSQATNSVLNAFKTFQVAFNNMSTYLKGIQKNFASQSFKDNQVQEKGIFNSLVDKVPFLHGGKGLISDDFDDVNRAMPPYKESVENILKFLQEAKAVETKAKNDLAEAAAEQSKVTAPTSDQQSDFFAITKDIKESLNPV